MISGRQGQTRPERVLGVPMKVLIAIWSAIVCLGRLLRDWKFVFIGMLLAIVGGALCFMNPGNTTLYLRGAVIGAVGALGTLGAYRQEDPSVAHYVPTVIVLAGLIVSPIIAT